MEPEAKYTLVGTAVVVLVALLVGALVWLHSTDAEGYAQTYKIYFSRHSLEGLQIRSDVKMQGIRVGSVAGFRISSSRPGSVEVLIRVDEAAPVREATRASVERHLITGIASVVLVNPTEKSPRLTEAPPNEPYPVIREGETELALTESAASIAQRADETMQRINRLLSDENQQAFGRILANLENVSSNVDQNLADLGSTLAELRRAAEEVRKTSVAIGADAKRLTARYDALGETSTTAVRDASGAIVGIGADVERTASRLDTLLANANIELRLTAQQLRATADALGTAARRLSDPRRALFGGGSAEAGPGEPSR